MNLVKICPTCGAENDINETLCEQCMANISEISPKDTDADIPMEAPEADNATDNHRHEDSSATVIERRRLLRFTATDGSGGFEVSNGAVIGREAEGNEYLKNYMTVSRRHARLSFNGSWMIEDLNSSNGIYVNEVRISQSQPCKIKDNDIIALSRSCKFTVKESAE